MTNKIDNNKTSNQATTMTNEDRISKANKYLQRMHEERIARNIAQLQDIRIEIRNLADDKNPDPDQATLIEIQKAELAYFEELLADDLTGTKLKDALDISKKERTK